MRSPFLAADILLPRKEIDLARWAVIACDQFTSQPEYWQQARTIAGDACSAVNLILPEAELSERGPEDIAQIQANMDRYLQEEIYERYPDAFVYVERSQADGSIRRGIVGGIDLEAYDYHAGADAQIRASEMTVESRIPARVAVREGASTETSHVILYADDAEDTLFTTAAAAKETGRLLYDFDLMLEGGHISGWLLDADTKERLCSALERYCAGQKEKAARIGKAPLIFAVGDGNHSLASAKACYEKAKAVDPGAAKTSLRYALVELENVHDPAQVFHPIHRIVRGIEPEVFVNDLRKAAVSGDGLLQPIAALDAAASGDSPLQPVAVFMAGGEEILEFSAEDPAALIKGLQQFIDAYLLLHGGEVDYIHGSDTLRRMIREDSVGLLMPLIGKEDFFRDIMQQGCFARKTFSIGNARDKRYYLEVRNISTD